MAKQDWANNETASRTQLNRPFVMASGTYNAVDDRFEIWIGPGRMRFPWSSSANAPDIVTYSGQAQRLIIDHPAAETAYVVFVRPSGATGVTPRFIVSGASLANAMNGSVDSPRFDAEPIGMVYASTLATADLLGPWITTAGATSSPWERRGEAPATMASRLRAVYRNQLNAGGSVDYAASLTASGLAHLHFPAPTGGYAKTFLSATVRYYVSGALSAGKLFVAPTFTIRPHGSSQGVEDIETHEFTVAQNPDDAVTRGARQIKTATVTGISRAAGNAGGFTLWAGFLSTATDAAVTPGLRIDEFEFIAIPGFYGINTTDPSD